MNRHRLLYFCVCVRTVKISATMQIYQLSTESMWQPRFYLSFPLVVIHIKNVVQSECFVLLMHLGIFAFLSPTYRIDLATLFLSGIPFARNPCKEFKHPSSICHSFYCSLVKVRFQSISNLLPNESTWQRCFCLSLSLLEMHVKEDSAELLSSFIENLS